MPKPTPRQVAPVLKLARSSPLGIGSERILSGLILTWAFLSFCFPLHDTDFWWHLKTGELILERGELPGVDWYTFMDWDKPWIDLHWGFQLLMTGLYHAGGSPLVILFKATILTLAVGIGMTAAGRTLPMWFKGLMWLPAIVAISGRGFERPEMLSQLFLACWLWIVIRLHERPRLVWLLPVIQLMWINCHTLFILGLIVGACYLLDRMVRQMSNGRWGLKPAPVDPAPVSLLWAGAAIVVAAFCNPYFEQGALFPLVVYRKFSIDQDFYSVRIGEFTRPINFVLRFGAKAFMNPYFMAEVILWCLTSVSFLWLASRRRWDVMRLLLFAGFSNLAWEATRNTNIFSIVAATVLCANCEDAILRGGPMWTRSRRATWGAGLLFLGLSCGVVTGTWNQIAERNKPFGFGEAPDWFAHEACRFAGQPGFPTYAFVAHNGIAGTYIYHNAPSHLVFMDGRLEVCSRRTFEIFDEIRFRMSRADRSWEMLMPRDDHGRLPVVVLDCRNSRLEINGMLQTEGWRLVYADHAATVFLEEKLSQSLELPSASLEPLMNPR